MKISRRVRKIREMSKERGGEEDIGERWKEG